MNDTFEKTINRPEARHRYWHILKIDRDFFPPAHEIFTLKFHNKSYEMKINHKDDIMTGQLYATHRFLEGDKIIVTKNNDSSFVLEAPDTKPYPEV